MKSWRARVVTVSTRAAAGKYDDEAGPTAAHLLRAMGFAVDPVVVVPDGSEVGLALNAAVGSQIDLLITCGGTGISRTDRTPDQTAEVLDMEIPGIAEYLRNQSSTLTPTASLSRGVAGVADRTLIVNLPGSTKAVEECMRLLADVVPHALEQLSGGDHAR